MTAPRPLVCTFSALDEHTGCLSVDGDLDYDTADQLLAETAHRLDGTPPLRELRLDCDMVGFCDSYGLSVLLMVHRRALAVGTTLRLERLRPPLRRLLSLTGVLDHFTGLEPAVPPAADAIRETATDVH